MKVEVDWALCDGNGVCAVEAPAVFELTDDDELLVLREEIGADVLAETRNAVRLCPKRAIALSEEGA